MHAASTNDYLVSVTKTLLDTGNTLIFWVCFEYRNLDSIKSIRLTDKRDKRNHFYIFSNLLEKTTDGIIKAAKVGDLLAVRFS